jgi:ribosomal protein S18 acetylase RimI-like enzyme
MPVLASFPPNSLDIVHWRVFATGLLTIWVTRVSGPLGRAVGFCMVKLDELYQLYVAPEARGSGLAAALLGDGEKRLASSGVTKAWLACAIGNERAMRFYEKNGWTRRGPMVSQLETPDGVYRLEVWRYEKRLWAE